MQTAIALIIVGITMLFALRKLVRILTNKEKCHCSGCNKGDCCNNHEQHHCDACSSTSCQLKRHTQA